jgi:hypothetical protein
LDGRTQADIGKSATFRDGASVIRVRATNVCALAIGAVIVTTVLAVGCRADRGDRNSAHALPPITGATSAEAALLSNYLRQLDGSHLRKISYFTSSYGEKGGQKRAWLAFEVPSDHSPWTRASWEALLIAGAVSDRSGNGVRPLGGVALRQLTPTGKVRGVGAVPISPPARASPSFATVRSASEAVRTNVAKRGLKLAGLDFVNVGGPAAVIRLTVSSVAQYRAHLPYDGAELLGNLIDSDHPRLAGFYLEVRMSGRLLHASAYARRLDTGSSWTNPLVQ